MNLFYPSVKSYFKLFFFWVLFFDIQRLLFSLHNFDKVSQLDFIDFIGVPLLIEDVIFTGSLANYNWSEYSDIDLHVVCDFIQIMPGMPKGKVRSRVIMTPQNAKRFLQALNENIQKYEQNFGAIDDPQSGMPPMNFGTPSTMA